MSAEVLRGKWPALAASMLPAYAFHAAFGTLGLWLMLKAVGS